MCNKKLVLEDGTEYTGFAFGADGNVEGEIVLNTAMSGYQRTLTDENYEGKIVLFTYPLIGNSGVNSKDFKNMKRTLKGMIIKELCEKPSNFSAEYNLDEVLKEMGIVGICGIDTRSLTKKIRAEEKVKVSIMDI
ncbi:MAG: carbamoyl-phosphate synthase domain-containing protein [Fusobacterium sp.]|uniref:carbamoyl-phosphate synthase domain-containing protein n=1 Tax=Fusobacterium sp. TaxID=68766 RepID=UPI0026DCB221|nr:carbamoyl-phosphate synthase domain-containing protein [Fusobacterium sp.]MDO4690063.1 carbamoyl-phosphate synthase domain-containing protein [Fusobacterium sp.]